MLVFDTIFLKMGKYIGNMVLKLLTTFIAVEGQFLPSRLHPNMRLLPGVIVPVFIEFTGRTSSLQNHFDLRNSSPLFSSGKTSFYKDVNLDWHMIRLTFKTTQRFVTLWSLCSTTAVDLNVYVELKVSMKRNFV